MYCQIAIVKDVFVIFSNDKIKDNVRYLSNYLINFLRYKTIKQFIQIKV